MPKLDVNLVWSDAHIPFEDARAFDLVLKVAKDIKPRCQTIIGDFADMMAVSSFPKTPPQLRWQLKDEVEAVNDRLDQLAELRIPEQHYFAGNHCIRGQKLAAREMVGLFDSLDPAELFRLRKRGWKFHRYQEHARIGWLWFVHDVGNVGTYAVWRNADAFQASNIQGHTHQAHCIYFGNALGKTHVSATLGWLGDPKYAEYIAPIKRSRHWQHAFGLAYTDRSTGNTHFQLVPIIEGRCVVNGRLYR